MKNSGRTIVSLVIVLTVISGIVATRSLTGSVSHMRHAGSLAPDAPGSLESRGEEVTGLITTLASASEVEHEDVDVRDPMVPYRAIRRTTSTATTTVTPSRPKYEVTAVILDEEDPTAIMRSGGRSLIVHLGDEVEGGRVTAIEADGVTLTNASGTEKIGLSRSN